MKKLMQLVLMLCLILSGAFSYAHGMARTEIEKGMGDHRLTIQKAQHGGVDKSESIVASIYEHVLSMASIRKRFPIRTIMPQEVVSENLPP